MWKKTSLLSLGVLLLTEFVCSAPTNGNELCRSISSTEIIYLTPRALLLYKMIVGFSEFADCTLDEELKIAKTLLKDEEIVNTNTNTMENLKKNVTNIINDIEKITKFRQNDMSTDTDKFILLYITADRKAQLIVNFKNLLEWHDQEKMIAPTAENILIDKALVRSGSKKWEQELNAKFTDFSQSFIASVENYAYKLPAEEKENEENLIKWCVDFNAQEGLENKIKMLGQFMSFH